ncbi:hypothetical protein SOASR030_01950 [Leminorella grimontii]|uniref:KilA-N DNA-binding domain-containing protein n=1 Tax=Leminorella grimontii TaxID=82981 RepID=A0AAV5MZH3_9GAMM|nr:ORF6N domain-containing protein [Leminorella grimontii]KFC95733.1 antirepressor [Leminorella grimontii ATCC 33999 = DSM 5078]GKX54083.1 hypothetical protein SOASR030_01950 [Leminorella grimontii]VFS60120.1 Phage anti-repressor protein [Leminorella grimontii]
MTTRITAETLSPIAYNQIPVITTELLAQLYGADENNIQQNHKRNAGRFIEGKHFFKATGEGLKSLRLTISQLQISPKTRSLILWTERGAARHAKMLETDQAWEVFEKLEDCYFNQRQESQVAVVAITQEERDAYNINALMSHYRLIYTEWKESIYPALKKMESPLASRLCNHYQDGFAFLMHLEKSLNSRLTSGQRPRIY